MLSCSYFLSMFVCVYACQTQPGCIRNTWTHGVWEYDAKEKLKKTEPSRILSHHIPHCISLTKKASENRTIWIWQKAMVEMLAFSFWPWSWVRRGQTSDWPLEEFSGLSIHSGDCVTWLHVMMASSWCAVSWWSYSVHSHQSPRHPNIPLEGSWVN